MKTNQIKLFLQFYLVAALAGCAPIDEQAQDLTLAELHLREGTRLLEIDLTQQAIDEHFDPVIDAHCAESSSTDNGRMYISRTPQEALFYMVRHAAAQDGDAYVINSPCAEALYLKGYASLDLGRIEEATEYVERALQYSPMNAIYLAERGHLYQIEERWSEALTSFEQAANAARAVSPEPMQEYELTRALRGIGFNLIELGRLDEAEEQFRECLEINPRDELAQNELAYIEQLRQGASRSD